MSLVLDLTNAPTKVERAKAIMGLAKGTAFSCAVVTKNTTVNAPRVFNCRLGVKKNLKGGKSPAAGKDHLVVVWETNAPNPDGTKGDYRTLNLNELQWIRVRKIKFHLL